MSVRVGWCGSSVMRRIVSRSAGLKSRPQYRRVPGGRGPAAVLMRHTIHADGRHVQRRQAPSQSGGVRLFHRPSRCRGSGSAASSSSSALPTPAPPLSCRPVPSMMSTWIIWRCSHGSARGQAPAELDRTPLLARGHCSGGCPCHCCSATAAAAQPRRMAPGPRRTRPTPSSIRFRPASLPPPPGGARLGWTARGTS